MTNQSQKELTLTRIFDAPRELVFKAWTDPRLMAQWFAPDLFTVPVCKLDPHPGGAIYLTMRGPDGIEYPMTGVFNEIVEPDWIVYTSGAIMDDTGSPQLETLTTVSFADENDKTKMTVHIVVTKALPQADFALAGMAEGWKQNLAKLGEALIKAQSSVK